MDAGRSAEARRSRLTLFWALGVFVGFQAALTFSLEYLQPQLRDPEYGYHLLQLRKRMAPAPHRALVVALGSSRIQLGFCPRAVAAAWPAELRTPVVFNFGLCNAGPLMELMCLYRLLDEGIRPDYVVLELLPPRLNQETSFTEAFAIGDRLGWRDWAHLRDHFGQARGEFRRWRNQQFLPWHTHRVGILSHWAPTWLPSDKRQDSWRRIPDATGWIAFHQRLSPEESRSAFQRQRGMFEPGLETFHITATPDRALRELLDVCRREQIGVVLLLTPEGSEFQGLYPPAARAEIDAYVRRLHDLYDVPVVDARAWISDPSFADGHHPYDEAAENFSERFGSEVLLPLLRARSKP
jgi:hypothetical protein